MVLHGISEPITVHCVVRFNKIYETTAKLVKLVLIFLFTVSATDASE